MTRILFVIIILCTIACSNLVDNQSPSISSGNQVFQFKKTDSINSAGVVRSKNRDYNSAMLLFNQALELEPNHPTILNNIGLTYASQEQFDTAEKFYDKALVESDSTYFEAGSNLGLLYYKIGEYRKGIGILTFVIEHSDDEKISTIAFINRAYNFIAIGNCQMAKKDIQELKDYKSTDQTIIDQIEKLEVKMLNCVQQWL